MNMDMDMGRGHWLPRKALRPCLSLGLSEVSQEATGVPL